MSHFSRDEYILEIIRRVERKMDSLDNKVDNVESKMDNVNDDIIQMKDVVKSLDEKVGIQNGRVGKLEMWKYGFDLMKASRSWRWPAFIGFISAIGVLVVGRFIETLLGGL